MMKPEIVTSLARIRRITIDLDTFFLPVPIVNEQNLEGGFIYVPRQVCFQPDPAAVMTPNSRPIPELGYLQVWGSPIVNFVHGRWGFDLYFPNKPAEIYAWRPIEIARPDLVIAPQGTQVMVDLRPKFGTCSGVLTWSAAPAGGVDIVSDLYTQHVGAVTGQQFFYHIQYLTVTPTGAGTTMNARFTGVLDGIT
jgi:hypothetical protein